MAEQEEPEQIKLMKRMVELAEYQARLSEQRTEMASNRTRMAEDRSRMSADRSRMSEDRSRMSADRSRMSEDRSRMSSERSEMSEDRSYLNAERTLSVWTRTALALMVFGIAVDRFALLLRHSASQADPRMLSPHVLSTMGGAALVAFGTVMALTCGIRYLVYAMHWKRRHEMMYWHGPYLAFTFAMLTVIFGIGLLLVMLAMT